MANCPAVLVIQGSDGLVLRIGCTGPAHREWHRFRDTGLDLTDMSRFSVHLEEGDRG